MLDPCQKEVYTRANDGCDPNPITYDSDKARSGDTDQRRDRANQQRVLTVVEDTRLRAEALAKGDKVDYATSDV